MSPHQESRAQSNCRLPRIRNSIRTAYPAQYLEVNDYTATSLTPDDESQLGDMQSVRRELDRIAEERKKLQGEFGTVLRYLMRSHNRMSAVQLSGRTDISAKTIGRYCRDGYSLPDLPHTLAICIGLNLHPDLAIVLLAKAGHCLDTGNSLHRFCLYLLAEHHMESLDIWNMRFRMAGFAYRLPNGSTQ